MDDGVSLATKVNPGGTINYTAVVTNTASFGNDAANVSYTHTLDANTTFVSNSAHASPIAFDNNYTAVADTLLEVGVAASGNPAVTATGSLFDNDTIATSPDAIQLQSFQNSSANGGTVSVDSAGHFSYLPPVNFTGTDTFTYTIRNSADNSLQNTGTVTISVNGPKVWYVNNSGANGDGRSSSPFNTLAGAAAVDGTGDIIYMFTGSGNYTGGITLTNNEQVIGNGVALVVNTFTLRAAGSRPAVVNGAGNGMTLGSGNTLSGFNFGNCTGGFAIQGASVGAIALNTMLINTNGGGLDLTGVSTPTATISLDSVTSSAGSKNINLVGLNGTISLGSGALSGASGNAFDVSGAGNAVITYSGTIGNTTARSVNVANKNGGSVSLSGAVSGSGTGINLTTNTGATINFTGGISLSTGTNAAFTATGGGTVTATQNNTSIVNTLTTTTATALNVANTTIGASGLTFRSINVTGNGSSPTNGIILNTTGSSGGLTVTGNSSGRCGGFVDTAPNPDTIIAADANDCSGGTIQSTGGNSLALTSVSNISLTRMRIMSSAIDGINGSIVTNFTLSDCFILNNGNATTERGVEIINLLGTSGITNTTMSGNAEDDLYVENTGGTLSSFPVTGSTFTTVSSSFGNDGIHFQGTGTGNATMSINVSSCKFDHNRGDHFQVSTDAVSNSVMTAFFQNNVLTGNSADLGDSITINSAGSAQLHVKVSGNSITGAISSAITLNTSNTSSIEGTLSNNVIGNPAVTDSGSSQGDGINVAANHTSTITVAITSNQISQYSNLAGIDLAQRSGSPTLNATITGNTVSNGGTFAAEGIFSAAGAATGDGGTMCLDLGSATNALKNTIVGSGKNGSSDFRVRQRFLTTVRLPSYGGTNQDTVAVVAFIQGRNNPSPPGGTPSGQATVPAPFTGGGFTGGAACTQPTTTAANETDETVSNQPNKLSHPGENPLEVVLLSEILSEPFTSLVRTPSKAEKEKDVAITGWPQWIWIKRVITASASSVASSINRIDETITSRAYASTVQQDAIETTNVASIRRDEQLRSSEMLLIQDARSQSNAYHSPEANLPISIGTLPAQKSVTIKYQVTVNIPPLARSLSTQGNVTFTGGPGGGVNTDDPETGTAGDATVTNIDTTITWTGAASTDWNTAGNWNVPGPAVSTYAPGATNPGVNDVVIPNVGAQPNISATDISVYSLNISNGRTLTITSPRILTLGGSPGGNLTLDGVINGGELRLGSGTHTLSNAGGTGSLSATNLMTVLSGSTNTLGNNLQAGALNVNAGGSLDITNRTLSLNSAGTALAVGGTLTLTGSTVTLNGSAAETIAGLVYNNLIINNSIGAHVTGVTLTGNATVNGVLTLTSSDLATGANTLTMPVAATSGPASGASDVVGNVKRTGFVINGAALSFGNPFNTIKINTGTTVAPADITLVIAKNAPATYAVAVQRSYTIMPNGGSGINATLRLHYRQAELNGNSETPAGNFNLRRLTGTWKAVVPTARNTGVAEDNWLENSAVTQFSEWTFAALAPTAQPGRITGHIADANGKAIEGAVVRLNGAQTRKMITDANGNYRFDDVPTDEFYTVTPSRANYSFNPFNRSFSQAGTNTEAAFTGTMQGDRENPLDTAEYFVRQQYVDVLGREPDEAGFNYWSEQILNCGADSSCIQSQRIAVAAAFFIEREYQDTGSFLYDLYAGALGRKPNYAEYAADRQQVVGGDTLEAKKSLFAEAFVQRAEFLAKYDAGLSADAFVDALIANVRASEVELSSDRVNLLSAYQSGGDAIQSRAAVVKLLADNATLKEANYNAAFVLTEYFAYLHRNADQGGYDFWLNVIGNREVGNYRGMVCAFITSTEYQQRFSGVVSHSNADCGR